MTICVELHCRKLCTKSMLRYLKNVFSLQEKIKKNLFLKFLYSQTLLFFIFYPFSLIVKFSCYKSEKNPTVESDIEDEDSFIVNDSEVEEDDGDDDGNVRDDDADDDDDDGDGDGSDDYGSDGGETRQKSRPNKR
jgi:hypothetical protein